MNYLWLLTLIALPFSEFFRLKISEHIYLRVFDLIAMMLIGWLFLTKRARLKSNKPLAIFILVLSTSFLMNWQTANVASLLYLLRTIFYLTLCFGLNITKVNRKFVQIWLSMSLLILIISGLLQYWFYPDLRNLYYLGYDPHYYRLFGLVLDPNIIGLLFVWAIFLFWTQPGKTKRVGILLSLLALTLTYSRISWLAFVIGSFYQLYQEKKIKYFAVVLMTIIFVAITLPRHFGESTNLLRVNSLWGKKESWNFVYQTVKAKPLLGIGFNNLAKVRPDNPEFPNHSAFGVDSSFATLLATAGIFGIVSYLWFGYCEFRQSKAKVFLLILFIHSLSVNSFLMGMVLCYYLLINLSLTQHKSH